MRNRGRWQYQNVSVLNSSRRKEDMWTSAGGVEWLVKAQMKVH
jgi:hypothetical protein